MSQRITPIEAPVSEPITLINEFTVPVEEADRFLQRWKDSARVMARQPGLIRARMHRSLDGDAQLRYVNVAEWESGSAFTRAQANPEFRASVQRMVGDPDLHVTARPGVYQVAVELHPGGTL